MACSPCNRRALGDARAGEVHVGYLGVDLVEAIAVLIGGLVEALDLDGLADVCADHRVSAVESGPAAVRRRGNESQTGFRSGLRRASLAKEPPSGNPPGLNVTYRTQVGRGVNTCWKR